VWRFPQHEFEEFVSFEAQSLIVSMQRCQRSSPEDCFVRQDTFGISLIYRPTTHASVFHHRSQTPHPLHDAEDATRVIGMPTRQDRNLSEPTYIVIFCMARGNLFYQVRDVIRLDDDGQHVV
jgi:hypothetical protein